MNQIEHKNRREYERIKVNVEGLFIIKDENSYIGEFLGYIDDISESGIKIKVAGDEYDSVTDMIAENSFISFQAMDSFDLYGREVTKIFEGNVNVVRKEKQEDVLFLGCKIKSLTSSLKEYIEERKVSLFIERIHTAKDLTAF